MKEITLKVPDQKVDLVLKLVEELGLEVSIEDLEIPEEYKTIVRERIRKSKANPKRFLDWEQIKDNFYFD